MAKTVGHGVTVARVALHLPAQAARRPEPWRRQVRSALRHASLQVALPPQVILVVRRLADPQPGALLGQEGALAASAWQREARARLYRLWRAAARPAYAAVPPTAEAVWFADEAEWLACLSWDLHRGIAASRWWWRQWLHPGQQQRVAAALLPLWQTHARWLPQSLTLLQQTEGSGLHSLLLHFTPAEMARVRALVAEHYTLPVGEEAQAVIAALGTALPASLRAAVVGLPPETEALLALCLGIVAAPVAVERYRRTVHHTPPGGVAGEAGAKLEGDERGADEVESANTAAAQAGMTAPRPVLAPVVPETSEETEVEGATPAGTAAPAPGAPVMATPDRQASGTARAETGGASEHRPLSAVPATRAAAALPRGAGQALATNLGGIWYLVNVLVALEWLPAQEAVSGWTKLASLARALLGDATGDDPVWALLATLAAETSSSSVAHTAVPPDDTETAATSRSTFPWKTPGAAAWLDQALVPVHDFLAQRLVTPNVFGDILRAPARLTVSRTHVDLFLTLEQIRLDVRQAGLDRNPGWVPELARIISFHYE